MALMGCVWERKAQVWEGPQSVTQRQEAVRAPNSRGGHKRVDIAFLPLLLLCSLAVVPPLQHLISPLIVALLSSPRVLRVNHLHSAARPHETPHIVVNNIQWDPSQKYKEREFTQWRGIMSEKSQLRAAMPRINGAMHYSAWGGRKKKRQEKRWDALIAFPQILATHAGWLKRWTTGWSRGGERCKQRRTKRKKRWEQSHSGERERERGCTANISLL